jgi:prepilin peptidase CpaA
VNPSAAAIVALCAGVAAASAIIGLDPRALLCGLLAAAVVADLASYRIPNLIPLAIISLFPLFALWVGLHIGDVLSHVAAFAVTLAAGFALFAWNKLGGGDVKLLASAALWVGWGVPLVHLVIWTAIIGGGVALAILICQRTVLGVAIGDALRARGWDVAVFDPARNAAPYAVAICGASFVMLLSPA